MLDEYCKECGYRLKDCNIIKGGAFTLGRSLMYCPNRDCVRGGLYTYFSSESQNRDTRA